MFICYEQHHTGQAWYTVQSHHSVRSITLFTVPIYEQEDSEVDPGKTNKERITTGYLSFPGTWNIPACSKPPEKRLFEEN